MFFSEVYNSENYRCTKTDCTMDLTLIQDLEIMFLITLDIIQWNCIFGSSSGNK